MQKEQFSFQFSGEVQGRKQSLISAKCRAVMPVDDIKKSCRFWTVSVLMFNCTAITVLVMNIFYPFGKKI